jgi:hypothetical protein
MFLINSVIEEQGGLQVRKNKDNEDLKKKPSDKKKSKKSKKDKKDKKKSKRKKKKKEKGKDNRSSKDKYRSRDKSKNKKEKKHKSDSQRKEEESILMKLGVQDQNSEKQEQLVQKVIDIYEWATSLNRRNHVIWENYISFLRQNKKQDFNALHTVLLGAMKALKYHKNCVTIWVQLTELWTSLNREFLNLNVFEINELFLELAESFYQVESHFLRLFEERYKAFLTNTSLEEKEEMLKNFGGKEIPKELLGKEKEEYINIHFSQTSESLQSAFLELISDSSNSLTGKTLMKDIEEILKTQEENNEKTWFTIISKLFEFKKFHQLKDEGIELYIYEKAISCVPSSSSLWKLYLEFLDTLPGKKKCYLFNALSENRKILHYTFPESFGFCIPYFFNKEFSQDIEDLFKKLIQELLAHNEHIYTPKFRLVFITSLYTLHKANIVSTFISPLQLTNPEWKSRLNRPDQESEYEIFDMIIAKYWNCIENYDIGDRAEIFQLLLNRMKRAKSKDDLFKQKFKSFAPSKTLFFNLCIEYKRIVQLDHIKSQTDDKLHQEFLEEKEKIRKEFWSQNSKEITSILIDLIKTLNPKVLSQLKDMIMFYSELYIDDVKNIQKVETALFSQMQGLHNSIG